MKENIYFLETYDGQVMRVPESKLDDFLKMDKRNRRKQARKKLVKKILSIFGGKKNTIDEE